VLSPLLMCCLKRHSWTSQSLKSLADLIAGENGISEWHLLVSNSWYLLATFNQNLAEEAELENLSYFLICLMYYKLKEKEDKPSV